MSKRFSKFTEGFHPNAEPPQAGEPWEGQGDFVLQLVRLENSIPPQDINRFRGLLACPICDKAIGLTQYFSGDWSWRADLMHTVTEHNIKPSPEFHAFVMGESNDRSKKK